MDVVAQRRMNLSAWEHGFAYSNCYIHKHSWNSLVKKRERFGLKRCGKGLKKQKKERKPSSYRHVPHSEKPQHLVQRRNARERRRVQAVNSAFSGLRKHIPYEPKHKRLSKVKTLRIAIDYIRNLEDMIETHDRQVQEFRQTVLLNSSYSNGYSPGHTDEQTWTRSTAESFGDCYQRPQHQHQHTAEIAASRHDYMTTYPTSMP
ncbi:achaete-scute homolog 1b-like [Gigantopelta aegis]|uniref:achaete-scute homolog 1b-like n=1 Tax=Gigantopelta aegis TaxID=1735272 RepID=UPI001B889584|nr:achaete-scute homolog 1b-like [Gigantopelta aegis]